MKKKIISMMVVAIVAVMMFSTNVLASLGSGTVTVPKGGSFVLGKSNITRTGAYKGVDVHVNSVAPTGNYILDNFSKCKVVLRASYNRETISHVVTITESEDKYVQIVDGKLNNKCVDLYFAGNNPDKSAFIHFDYDGR